MDRLTRQEACDYLRCSRYTLWRMENEGLFEPGDFYSMGTRRLYIKDRLDQWILKGGEAGAKARLAERRRGNDS